MGTSNRKMATVIRNTINLKVTLVVTGIILSLNYLHSSYLPRLFGNHVVKRDLAIRSNHVCEQLLSPHYFLKDVPLLHDAACQPLYPTEHDCLLYIKRQKSFIKNSPATPNYTPLLRQNITFHVCQISQLRGCIVRLTLPPGNPASCTILWQRDDRGMNVSVTVSLSGVYEKVEQMYREATKHVRAMYNSDIEVVCNDMGSHQTHIVQIPVREQPPCSSLRHHNVHSEVDNSQSQPAVSIHLLVLRGISRGHFFAKWKDTISSMTSISKANISVLNSPYLQTSSLKWSINLCQLLVGKSCFHRPPGNVSHDESESHDGNATLLEFLKDQAGFDAGLQTDACPFDPVLSVMGDSRRARSFVSTAFNSAICAANKTLNIDRSLTNLMLSYTTQRTLHALLNRRRLFQLSVLTHPSSDLSRDQDRALAESLGKIYLQYGDQWTTEPRSKAAAVTIIVGDHGDLLNPLSQKSAFWNADQFNPPFVFLLPKWLELQLVTSLSEEMNHLMHNVFTSEHVGGYISSLAGELCCKVPLADKQYHVPSNIAMPWTVDIALSSPIVSVCEKTNAVGDIPRGHSAHGSKYGVNNDSVQVGFALFALGMLNSRLLDCRATDNRYGNVLAIINKAGCRRVKGLAFQHVSAVKQDDSIISLLRLTVVCHYGELYTRLAFDSTIELQRQFRTPSRPHIEVTFVDLVGHNDTFNTPTVSDCTPSTGLGLNMTTLTEKHFGIPGVVKDLHENCLYLIIRAYKHHSASFEASNLCSSRSYNVTFHVKTTHMTLSVPSPITKHIEREECQFLLSAWMDVYVNVQPQLLYSTDVEVIKE